MSAASPTPAVCRATSGSPPCIPLEQDGTKGAYTINLVDQVTRWQVLGCVERLSEQYLPPLLQQLLEQFPFLIHGFHSDNGAEYINHTTAALLEKLRIECAKSRAAAAMTTPSSKPRTAPSCASGWATTSCPPRRPTRSTASTASGSIRTSTSTAPAPSLRPDRHGKLRRVYRDWHTPYEALAALPAPQRGLLEGVTLATLQARASECSDTVFAACLQQRLRTLQRTCEDLALPWGRAALAGPRKLPLQ